MWFVLVENMTKFSSWSRFQKDQNLVLKYGAKRKKFLGSHLCPYFDLDSQWRVSLKFHLIYLIIFNSSYMDLPWTGLLGFSRPHVACCFFSASRGVHDCCQEVNYVWFDLIFEKKEAMILRFRNVVRRVLMAVRMNVTRSLNGITITRTRLVRSYTNLK